MPGDKRPESVLVVIHDRAGRILLLERARHPGYWQSVTGSLENGESPRRAARREVLEETGIAVAAEAFEDWHLTNRFEIFPEWRDRYPAGVTTNLEHVFSLRVSEPQNVCLAREEHRAYRWLPWRIAADACFSWSNRDAILMLGQRFLGGS